jgi:hypothetical protein
LFMLLLQLFKLRTKFLQLTLEFFDMSHGNCQGVYLLVQVLNFCRVNS